MTRVDFYILEEAIDSARLRVAARIAEKATLQNRHVYINAADEDESHRLDEVLWTFSQGSFVPHRVIRSAGDGAGVAEPVLIGVAVELPEPCEVMINLAGEVPEFFSRYERVAEIVDAQSSRRDAGRSRYKYYRDRGYELTSHKI
ncbi:MAG TPA: DNA polymerase III subunit chi [Gammaproteobacteria bacterium]|nr:DNA polymerase III subunit chi [Gammaproteobacteria bacterium]